MPVMVILYYNYLVQRGIDFSCPLLITLFVCNLVNCVMMFVIMFVCLLATLRENS